MKFAFAGSAAMSDHVHVATSSSSCTGAVAVGPYLALMCGEKRGSARHLGLGG